MSAVLSTMLVMVIVWLSTLYPARKASEVARRPLTGREVGTTAIRGDSAAVLGDGRQRWSEQLHGEVPGTRSLETRDAGREGGSSTRPGQGLRSGKAWLAPFDLGVSQLVRLETTPTTMEDVYDISVTLKRESGDISNWKRVNRRFLNTLRKQFLIWRTLRAEDRDKYWLRRNRAGGRAYSRGACDSDP